jgi:hypothetical protein
MVDETNCCNRLFSDFKFEDIRRSLPPKKKGVYIIRVKHIGTPPQKVVEQVKQVILALNWPLVGEKMLDRVKRIERVNQCPVIYIGAAGSQSSSKYTLHGRYKDFAGRHTAMYPLWALLYFGWELEYGWIEDESPATAESKLKERYKQEHGGSLPAFVYR